MGAARVRLKRSTIDVKLARYNWTRTHLARLLGVHRSYLSDLLAGRKYVGPTRRQRLLEILGATFDDLFEIIPASTSPRPQRSKTHHD
jgi:transcriptional regulator with XRE-family HTH domain